MNTKLRKILFILIIIPIVIIAGIWFFVVKPLAENKINAELSNLGTANQGDAFRVFFLGIDAPSTLTLNTKPIPIPLEKASLEIPALSILTLNPKLRLSSDLFGGHIQGNLSYKISDKSIAAELNASELQLSKYQLASMLGISDGKISINFSGKSNDFNSILPTKIFFMLKGLKKPSASKLPQWISPIGIKIPAIDSGNIIAEVICSSQECKSSKFSITSSLGQASGDFSFSTNGNFDGLANITVALTQAGRSELLPYFALLNQELLSTPERPFIIKFSRQNNSPKLSVVPIRESL